MKAILKAAAVCLSLSANAMAEPFSWGANSNGQLGDGTTTDRSTPVAVYTGGVLSGKTITDFSTSATHALVATSDGKVYAWGSNARGQLGDGTTTSSSVAVAVDMTGAMLGKSIARVAAGTQSSYAVASDGTVFSWGLNDYGQLGDGTTTDRSSPVAVDMSGVLSGKTVIDVVGGFRCAVVLASDGTLHAWGINTYGQLGNGTTTSSLVPVAVDMTGAIAGETPANLSGGSEWFFAVTSSGRLFGWGANMYGMLGDGSTTNRSTPVEVDMSGVLSGKTIVSASGGGSHTAAITSDGMVFSWGYNGFSGGLGTGTTGGLSDVPVAVDMTGVLSGKFVTAVAAGGGKTTVATSDGAVFAWGGNASGDLGDGTMTDRPSPVAVDMSGALAGMTVTELSADVFTVVALAVPASSSISPASRFTYGANFGWLNWRWSGTSPAAPVIETTMLHGRVYAADVGWIDLGDGTPTSVIGQYTQSGGDIGVNHDGAGNLSGYAYGANIGWIYFDPSIAYPPRVNLTTGAFMGYAYSANCGWINLAGIKTRIFPGTDEDVIAGGGSGDGIADAWEREQAAAAGYGNDLSLLGGSMNADFDHDGLTDYQEYLADTNPFLPNDRLEVTSFLYDPLTGDLDIEWNGSLRRNYLVECSADLVHWSPVGDVTNGVSAAFTLAGPAMPHLFFKVRAALPAGGQ